MDSLKWNFSGTAGRQAMTLSCDLAKSIFTESHTATGLNGCYHRTFAINFLLFLDL